MKASWVTLTQSLNPTGIAPWVIQIKVGYKSNNKINKLRWVHALSMSFSRSGLPLLPSCLHGNLLVSPIQASTRIEPELSGKVQSQEVFSTGNEEWDSIQRRKTSPWSDTINDQSEILIWIPLWCVTFHPNLYWDPGAWVGTYPPRWPKSSPCPVLTVGSCYKCIMLVWIIPYLNMFHVLAWSAKFFL